MSLINKMLKDLETRQSAPDGDRSPRNLYQGLRPVGRPKRPYRAVMLSVGLIATIMATATLLFARGHWDASILPTKITQWGEAFGQNTTNSVTNVAQAKHDDVTFANTVNMSVAEKVESLQTATLAETPQFAESKEVAITGVVPASTIENASLETEVKTKSKANKKPKAKAKKKAKKETKTTTAARKEKPKKPAALKKVIAIEKKKSVKIQEKQEQVAVASLDRNITDSSLSEASEQGVVERKLRTLTPADEAERAYSDAVESLKQNRVGDAEERLRFAVTTDPQHTKALELLAGLLLRRGSLVEAEQSLNDGRVANPEHYRFAQLLARIYLQRGASKQALTLLEQSQPYAKTDAEFFGFLAALYQRDGQHDKAIKAYSRAVTLNPQQSQWWLGLGISFEAESNWSAAHQAYRRAIAGHGLNGKLGRYARERLASVERRVSSN